MPNAAKLLIVEDEFLIAMDLEQTLKNNGYLQVEMSGDFKEAIERSNNENWDAVILDANLNGTSSEPIAHALRSKKTPFIVVTGYDSEKLPSILREAPSLQKPIRDDLLLTWLQNHAGQSK